MSLASPHFPNNGSSSRCQPTRGMPSPIKVQVRSSRHLPLSTPWLHNPEHHSHRSQRPSENSTRKLSIPRLVWRIERNMVAGPSQRSYRRHRHGAHEHDRALARWTSCYRWAKNQILSGSGGTDHGQCYVVEISEWRNVQFARWKSTRVFTRDMPTNDFSKHVLLQEQLAPPKSGLPRSSSCMKRHLRYDEWHPPLCHVRGRRSRELLDWRRRHESKR